MTVTTRAILTIQLVITSRPGQNRASRESGLVPAEPPGQSRPGQEGPDVTDPAPSPTEPVAALTRLFSRSLRELGEAGKPQLAAKTIKAIEKTLAIV